MDCHNATSVSPQYNRTLIWCVTSHGYERHGFIRPHCTLRACTMTSVGRQYCLQFSNLTYHVVHNYWARNRGRLPYLMDLCFFFLYNLMTRAMSRAAKKASSNPPTIPPMIPLETWPPPAGSGSSSNPH